MARETAIEFCHHTFNPWWGCSPCSRGCQQCYAKAVAEKREFYNLWGANSVRRTLSDDYWKEPLRWDEALGARRQFTPGLFGDETKSAVERERVFAGSMCDIFEPHPKLWAERERLWNLIRNTHHLDWLIITKRPREAREMLSNVDDALRRRIWLLVSVEDQKAVWRIEPMLAIDVRLKGVIFEPLLGPITLRGLDSLVERGLKWAIIGGETGAEARPCRMEWIFKLVDQLKAARIPTFIKQLGRHAIALDGSALWRDRNWNVPEDWPTDLRLLREYPRGAQESL